MAALIDIRELCKTYASGGLEVHAVRGVTLSIAAGEMVAIMGPSGSGKSTMLNVLGTLDRPTAGEYRLDGESVGELDEPALASLRNHKIGFVFQSFNLLPRETALENVELPMIYAGAARAARRRKAEAALARVGLAERMDHLPNQLSGGQQQRVSIARAIVNEPLLLLADEPTGALDSKTARQVMELLLDLHRSGMTVAVVTHDPAVAAYAGRVITFRDGHVVSDERTQNETNPHPPAVRADLGLHG